MSVTPTDDCLIVALDFRRFVGTKSATIKRKLWSRINLQVSIASNVPPRRTPY